MILAFLLPLIAKLGVPERIREPVAYIVLALTVVALLWAGIAIYDASVIERHEAKQVARSVEALDTAAEQRANDAIVNIIAEKERENAIQAAPTGTGLSDPELALNCARLRKLGRNPPACR